MEIFHFVRNRWGDQFDDGMMNNEKFRLIFFRIICLGEKIFRAFFSL